MFSTFSETTSLSICDFLYFIFGRWNDYFEYFLFAIPIAMKMFKQERLLLWKLHHTDSLMIWNCYIYSICVIIIIFSLSHDLRSYLWIYFYYGKLLDWWKYKAQTSEFDDQTINWYWREWRWQPKVRYQEH